MGFVNLTHFQAHLGLEILPLELPAAPPGTRRSATKRGRTATEHRLEEIGEIAAAAKTSGLPPAAILPLLPGLLKFLGMLPILAVFVVFLAVFGVAQHLVGFVDLLEFLLGVLIVGVDVGMVLAG